MFVCEVPVRGCRRQSWRHLRVCIVRFGIGGSEFARQRPIYEPLNALPIPVDGVVVECAHRVQIRVVCAPIVRGGVAFAEVTRLDLRIVASEPFLQRTCISNPGATLLPSVRAERGKTHHVQLVKSVGLENDRCYHPRAVRSSKDNFEPAEEDVLGQDDRRRMRSALYDEESAFIRVRFDLLSSKQIERSSIVAGGQVQIDRRTEGGIGIAF